MKEINVSKVNKFLRVEGAELTEASVEIIEWLLRTCVRALLVFQQLTSSQLQVSVIIVLLQIYMVLSYFLWRIVTIL